MQKLTVTICVLATMITVAYGGAPTYSGKEMKQVAEVPPCPEWYRDTEWNVSLWGTYALTGNNWQDDRYFQSDHAWGGGVDVKYFFHRYFGVGLEGWATESTRQRAQESLSDSIFENCPYCQGRGVVKTSMTTSVELHRTLNTVMRKYQEEVHEFRVILNPDVLKRLKEEDEDLLIELERRYASKLMFRGDPTFHHEKFVITDASNGAELKA